MRTILLAALATPLLAQDPLSLRDAAKIALRENRAVIASTSGVSAAASRAQEARAGWLPKVNYSETYTRSDNPVFVFSSLLTQHEFGAENFNIGPLNRPDAMNNFQSVLTVDQAIYDAGATRNAVRSAALGQDASAEHKRQTDMQVLAGVVKAYYGAVLATENLKAAEQAVRSAEADLRRAEAVRTAGMSTDVDVLSIRVHLSAMTEQRIRRAAELDVAHAELNDALGLPLDAAHTLSTPLRAADVPAADAEAFERDASMGRPEARTARLASALAALRIAQSRSALLPQLNFHAAFEVDRRQFASQGGANWMVSAGLRWNLFNGLADRARIAEAEHARAGSRAEQQRVDSAVRLDARRAWSAVRSATQRIEVAKAAIAEAEESLRITQNRYEAGMSNVADLLRNETAVLESRTRYSAAVHDQRIAAAMLELAAGRLTADSEAFN